jgi:hypothetical protein
MAEFFHAKIIGFCENYPCEKLKIIEEEGRGD